jgi:hypothetical protein
VIDFQNMDILEIGCQLCAQKIPTTVGQLKKSAELSCPECNSINFVDLNDLLARSELLAKRVIEHLTGGE